jgi:hypothetical protein
MVPPELVLEPVPVLLVLFVLFVLLVLLDVVPQLEKLQLPSSLNVQMRPLAWQASHDVG